MEFLGAIIAIIIIYLVVNKVRNSDPLNRKCAAEICNLLTRSEEDITAAQVADIFMANARYNKQAGHIVSMVPALLIEEGYPKNAAMSTVPLLREAQMMIPK